MKQRSAAFGAVIVGVAGIVLVGLVYSVAGHFLMSNNTTVCQSTGAKHIVKVENNAMVPTHTRGRLCDTLTIINEDKADMLIAFGPHEHHVAYDGVLEKLISQGQSVTVTFVKTGNYQFHDHLQDIAQGTFSVSD